MDCRPQALCKSIIIFLQNDPVDKYLVKGIYHQGPWIGNKIKIDPGLARQVIAKAAIIRVHFEDQVKHNFSV